MSIQKIKRIIKTGLLLFLLFLSCILFLNLLVQRPGFQAYFIKKLSETAPFTIRTSRIEMNFWKGFGLLVHDLEARSKSGLGSIRAPRVRIIMDLGRLLKGDITPAGVHLERPVIYLDLQAPKGKKSSLAPPSPSVGLTVAWPRGLKTLSVSDAEIHFKQSPFTLTHLQGHASMEDPSFPARIKTGGHSDLEQNGRKARIRWKGEITQNPNKPTRPEIQLSVSAEKIPLPWIPHPKKLSLKDGRAGVKAELRFRPDGSLSVKGQAVLERPRFDLLSGSDSKTYLFPRVSLDFRSVIMGSKITVPDIKLEIGGTSFSLNLELDLENPQDPSILLEAESAPMDLSVSKILYPSPLLPGWIQTHLFPMLKDGKVQLARLALKGPISRLGHLGTPADSEAFSLRLLCRDFKVSGKETTVPFENVSADVIYEKGDFRISRLKATFGKSVIREAALLVRRVTGKNPAYDVHIDGTFDLPGLMDLKGLSVLGSEIPGNLDRLGIRAGRVECRADFRYEKGWPYPRPAKGEFVFRDVLIRQERLGLPLSLDKISFSLGGDGENRFKGSGSLGKTTFHALGLLGGAADGFPLQWANLSAEVDTGEVLPLLFSQPNPPLTFSRPVSCRWILERDRGGWSCNGKIALEGMRIKIGELILDPPEKEGEISVDLNSRPGGWIELKSLRYTPGQSSLTFSGNYNTRTRELSPIRAVFPRLSLAEAGLRYGPGRDMIRGILKGSLEIRFRPGQFSLEEIYGEIRGMDLSFPAPWVSSSVKDCSFEGRFSGKKITLNSGTIRIGNRSFSVRGALTGWKGLQGELTIHSDFLDTADFSPPKDSRPGTTPDTQPGDFLGRTDIRMEITVNRGRWKSLDWGPLKATLCYQGGDLYLRRARLRLPHGLLDATGRYWRGARPEILLSTHIQLKDQPLKTLLTSLGIRDTQIEGDLTFRALLSFKGRSREEFISSLEGGGDFLLEKGVIRKSNVLIKVLNLLSIQKIFKKRPPDLSKEGFYYESIRANAVLNKGILHTRDLLMKSPVMNAVATGDLNLARRTFDLEMGIRPLETVDTVVSKIPLLGYIVTGPDKSFLTYFFKVRGPWKDPRVEYLPFKHMGKGVADAFKRLFSTPGRIYKDLSGEGNGSGKGE
ncbi:MAG: AsmA-like C-terminal domain-containing protein [Deltaproteobacteria bacterium]|nr:AsmA-like C-terminal domain-containing protein [Deltaproteobacteria bacterium]MBW2130212.1 AsmA-like C-terminal domain-containing protein [Deltaproteobacteria bacterium]